MPDLRANPTIQNESHLPADQRRVLIGVCTLNEAANIVCLVKRLREAIPDADVLVVDDDSPDDTASLVADLAKSDRNVKLDVRHEQTGLGSAIRHAMSRAISEGYEFFLNLDGDLSHDPDQLRLLLQHAVDHPQIDVVIGSRYVRGGAIVGWPLHRRLMSLLVNRFATFCLGLPVRDCSGSMRCYRVTSLASMGMGEVRIDGYAVLEELLIVLQRRGARFAEVPITFTDRQHGSSKLTFREALRSTRQILGLAIAR